MKQDYRSAPIEKKTRALLDFAWKLTREQHECRADDVRRLRSLT